MKLVDIIKILLKLPTAATPGGVATRDIAMTISTIVTVLSLIRLITPEQEAYLNTLIGSPEIAAAVGLLVTTGISAYRVFFKSSSDKAAEIAKQIDAKVPTHEPVVQLATPNRFVAIVGKPKA